MKLFFLAFVMIGSVVLATPAFAQSPQQIIDDVQNDIRVQTTPQFPKAGDPVDLELISYSTDLNRATITWRVDGKTQLTGVGETKFSTQASSLGTATVVSISIITSAGETVSRSVTIQPADIDLLWQATSYVPPLYEGKALYPHMGLIKVFAMPSLGKALTMTQAKNFVFKWSKNDEVLGTYSGYGKNTFSYRGSIISKPVTISVEVTDVSGTIVGKGSTTVTPQSPQIALYEDSPLYGPLYNQTLTSVGLTNKEFVLLSVPYFFNTQPEAVNFQYDWNMNGQTIPAQAIPSEITLKPQGNNSGSAVIGLQIQNLAKVLQFANASIAVSFNPNQ